MRINKEIFKIAIPNILGNITIPLIGLVDAALMGREVEKSTVLIGAIFLGGLIFDALYWNLGFLRISTTGITAQAFGAKDKEQQANTLFRAFILGAILAIIILLFQKVIANIGFHLLSNAKNQEALAFARKYYSIRIWGAPAILLLFGLRGWFYGMQNATYPMIITITVNIVNMLASWYFVKVQGMGVQGVATGTLVAQYTCLLVGVFLLLKKYNWIFKFIKLKLLLIQDQLKRFFFVSGFVFVRNILLFAVFAWFTYYSSAVGEDYFAINQILLKLFLLMSYAVDGFAYASEALVGRFKGEGKENLVNKTILWTMIWGVGFGLLYAISYLIAGESILKIFDIEIDLIESAKPYFIWISLISIVGAVAFIWDGVYNGATLVVPMVISMAIATGFYFLSFFLLKDDYPKEAIWMAMFVYMLTRSIVQWVLYIRLQKKIV